MLYEDLRDYGRTGATADRRIRNKCKAEMAYYAVIREMLAAYGAGDGKDMSKMHAGYLCIARDDMAAKASDQGLVQFMQGGRIESFADPETGTRSRDFSGAPMRAFVRHAILNSAALRTTVSTSIAMRPENMSRAAAMTDDEAAAATDAEFERILDENNPNSIFSKVVRICESFDHDIDPDGANGEYDMYAFGVPEEAMTDDGQKRPTGRYLQGLKISPLMPELRSLRESGMGAGIGLYKDQRSAPEGANNLPAMFDPGKRLLTAYPASTLRSGYMSLANGAEFSSGILFGHADYHDSTYSRDEIRTRGFEEDLEAGGGETVTWHVEGKALSDMQKSMSVGRAAIWRMCETLSKHSQQQLNETDLDVIARIAGSAGTRTSFGDVSDMAAVEANMDAYMGYLDHVCSEARKSIQSHEFGIHFEEQTAFSDRNSGSFLPLMYFTGERTDEWNRARANGARYLGVYPYAEYTPKNLSTSPVAGDVAPAAYNLFTVTKGSHRRSGANAAMNDPSLNPYVHTNTITAALCAGMRETFDGYMGTGRSDDLELAKSRRQVGMSDADDLSRFIGSDGRPDAAMIASALIEDMDAVKTVQKAAFMRPENSEHMRSILQAFIDDQTEGWEREDGREPDMDDAMYCFLESGRGGNTPAQFRSRLAARLERLAVKELRESYGRDLNSYTVTMHAYRRFLGDFASKCAARIESAAGIPSGDSARMQDAAFPQDMTSGAAFAQGVTAFTEIMDGTVDAVSDPDSPILARSMDELFGSAEHVLPDGSTDTAMAQRVVLKANMCRHMSCHFMRDDYDNLLRMLSYTDQAWYDPRMHRNAEAVRAAMPRNATLAVQLYDAASYGIENAASYNADDVPDFDDNDDTSYASPSEERLWFESTFARTGNPGDRTLAWVQRTDFDASPDLETGRYDEDALDHALFEATHPLQIAALRRTAAALRRTEGNSFDPERLAVTEQGTIYYTNPDGSLALKLGPVTEEKAYPLPYTEECPADEPGSVEADLPVLDENGWPVRDSQGRVQSEKRHVRVYDWLVLDQDGKLANPVVFGALDTPSMAAPEARDGMVANRIYGVSAKIRNWDGYDHTGNKFHDRLEYGTYQMSVLENLDRSLAMYRLAKFSPPAAAPMARSLAFTNACASSLQKCYRTGTYVIDEKEKCRVADLVLSTCVSRHPDGTAYAASVEERRVANLFAAQCRQYHDRVVLQGVSLDQNIGLYNMAMNLGMCTASNVIGDPDAKSMLLTDGKSMRVAAFAPNPYADPVLTGTAKRMGAVMFLTDAAELDRVSGELRMDPKAMGAGPEAQGKIRCALVSTGILDVTGAGGIDMRPVTYPGGQAVDRLQLSINAIEKALYYHPGVSFCMANLGWNMEDGYIVSEDAAPYLGHFADGSFHAIRPDDKFGETEAGNKGVCSKVVRTSIGRGMDDADAEREFMARFTYEFLQREAFCHGSLSDPALAREFPAALENAVRMGPGNGGFGTVEEILLSLPTEGGGTVGSERDLLRDLTAGRGAHRQGAREQADEIRGRIFDALRGPLADIGERLKAAKTEPFYGQWKLEHDPWQLMRDNPGLDVVFTNVCICTRSNPSLLMHLSENLEADRQAMADAGIDPDDPAQRDPWLAENGKSVLFIRNEAGEKVPVMGAMGKTPVYVDSHTGDEKNKNYADGSSARNGRKWASQERFALQAKNADGALPLFVANNDPTLARQIGRYQRKILMNGFTLKIDANGDLAVDEMARCVGGADLEPSGDGVHYVSDRGLAESFTDMSALAAPLAAAAAKGSQEEVDAALKSLAEDLDFSKLLAIGSGQAGVNNRSVDTALRAMFTASIGKYGGSYILLPDNMSGANLETDIGLRRNETLYDDNGIPVGEGQEEPDPMPMRAFVRIGGKTKTAAPLFTSSLELTNMESELVSAPTDDRHQFKIFKTALAGAVVDALANMQEDGIPAAGAEACSDASRILNARLASMYADIPKEKSLSLEDMNAWLKKNLYATVFPNSKTCVWSGDPTLEIDEIGISFKTAKDLDLLTPKKDLDEAALAAIPDTYEFMAERYEPLTDTDLAGVNRNPGQTTGCLRAMRFRIDCADGEGVRIHPACATIFDGDFDGDTVGLVGFKRAMAIAKADPAYAPLVEEATHELLARFGMRGSMVHEADYTEIAMPDGSGEKIPYAHPLFIAGNADYAIAKHNMAAPGPDGKPACGYDIGLETDCVTAMANMLEHARQDRYCSDNLEAGRISEKAAGKIREARSGQIGALRAYFDRLPDSAYGAAEWKAMAKEFDAARNAPGMSALESLEARTFHRMAKCYRDMAGFVTAPSMMVHGATQHEMLFNIIRDTNVHKKGKQPQLAALTKFSGTHGRLSVGKDENGKTALLTDGKPTGKFDPDIRMSNIGAVSDVPPSKHNTPDESNIIAQSDKSDATGIGGAAAQQLQKIMSPFGYGRLALRISGPITQSYLDAKQNVLKCEKNLKVGKFLLPHVLAFEKIPELSDQYLAKFPDRSAALGQVYAGQYTAAEPKGGGDESHRLTVHEACRQFDNFIQMMGHPGFSPVDAAEFEACMEHFVDPRSKTARVQLRPVKSADKQYDVTFASMYASSSPETYAGILKDLAGSGRSPWSGSSFYDGHIDASAVQAALKKDCEPAAPVKGIEAEAPDPETQAPQVGLPGLDYGKALEEIRERQERITERAETEESKPEAQPSRSRRRSSLEEMNVSVSEIDGNEADKLAAAGSTGKTPLDDQ